MAAQPKPFHPKVSPGAEAWRLIFQLFMRQKPRFAALAAEFDLTPTQAHALVLIEPDAPLPMSELGYLLECDASNVTGIVDRLEAHRLIERRPAPFDRRVKLIALTDFGKDVRTRALARVFEPPAELADLPQAEQRALRDILRRALAPDG